MAPVAKRLFGDDAHRLSRLKGQATIGNWGGLPAGQAPHVCGAVLGGERPELGHAHRRVRHHLQRGPLGVFRLSGQSARLLRHVRRRRSPEAHAHLPPCEARWLEAGVCLLCLAGGSAWSTAASSGMVRSISSRGERASLIMWLCRI